VALSFTQHQHHPIHPRISLLQYWRCAAVTGLFSSHRNGIISAVCWLGEIRPRYRPRSRLQLVCTRFMVRPFGAASASKMQHAEAAQGQAISFGAATLCSLACICNEKNEPRIGIQSWNTRMGSPVHRLQRTGPRFATP
jgi:hypothetical protein